MRPAAAAASCDALALLLEADREVTGVDDPDSSCTVGIALAAATALPVPPTGLPVLREAWRPAGPGGVAWCGEVW